jgi:hypothetical protein
MDMDLYKLVKWNNPPTEQLLSLIDTPVITNKKVGHVGALPRSLSRQMLQVLDVHPDHYEFFNILLVYFLPQSSIVTHCDICINDPTEQHTNQTLILPLKNCENLKWSWHTITDSSAVHAYKEEGKFTPVPIIDSKYTRPIKEIFCTDPFVSNVEQWHNLSNIGNDISIAISIRLLPWSNKTDLSLPPVPGIVAYE